MAYTNESLAYDLSLFEEPEVSVEVEAEPKQNKIYDIDKERRSRNKLFANPLKSLAIGGLSLLGIFALVAIIYGQAQLTELNHEITEAQKTLEELSSVYTQVEMAVETKLGPSVVEEYAKNNLGMSKADSGQKEFISFSEGDKAVVAGEDDLGGEKNIFEKFFDIIAHSKG